MVALPPDVLRLLRLQEGAVTAGQAREAGLTQRQLRTLLSNGWRRPTRGVLICPEPPNPFRASVWAALLVTPSAAACGITAARIHGLWGLPEWTVDEVPELLLPQGRTYEARAGVRVRSGLRTDEWTLCGRLPITTISRTVADLVVRLSFDDLVCLIDSALASGWRPDQVRISRRRARKLRAALALADGRSESAFETLLRLLLVRAGLVPESLQYDVFDAAGRFCARLDLAWPSIRLAVEADGRAHHDTLPALYRDRTRANGLELLGRTVLRFTWADLKHRPDWVVAQVRQAISVANEPAARSDASR